ncbi:SGNH/GDSL hydrolase family protein [Spirosoma areae]
MLVIGNSIMSHGPAPDLGWFNFNGMAASAPEKDFVHLLTSRLQLLHPPTTVKLQSGGGFERDFGKPNYSLDEFNQVLQEFKPDLILIRIGENVEDGDVQGRQFEMQFRQLLERLANAGQRVKIVSTTSVWERPKTDAVIRKVINERGYSLVDLSCLVGQGPYFASQYANPGVAAHPNDAGMQKIADLIWDKIQ